MFLIHTKSQKLASQETFITGQKVIEKFMGIYVWMDMKETIYPTPLPALMSRFLILGYSIIFFYFLSTLMFFFFCKREKKQFILLAQKDKIVRFDLTAVTSPNKTLVEPEELPVKGLHNIIAVDFDMKNNCVYFADIFTDTISVCIIFFNLSNIHSTCLKLIIKFYFTNRGNAYLARIMLKFLLKMNFHQ